MAYLLERDTLNGKEGRAFCTINGQQVEMFSMKKIQVDSSLEEADMKVVGTRLVQKKTTGITFSGSMDLYYGTPQFRQMVYNYRKTGAMPYFTIQITNDDPATSVGRQTIILYNVKVQSLPLAMLDADTDILTETVAFSFTHFEIIDSFNAPAQLGAN
jgi:hypothetical protein